VRVCLDRCEVWELRDRCVLMERMVICVCVCVYRGKGGTCVYRSKGGIGVYGGMGDRCLLREMWDK